MSFMRISQIDDALKEELNSVYEEMIWLSKRPNVTPTAARAWYTHVRSGRFRLKIQMFSGKVSVAASKLRNQEVLRLEHYRRIQTTLTKLIERHRDGKIYDFDEFLSTLISCERVHIVTFNENYSAMKARGNYKKAGIELVPWRMLPKSRQEYLWKKMLKGKVANAAKFSPTI